MGVACLFLGLPNSTNGIWGALKYHLGDYESGNYIIMFIVIIITIIIIIIIIIITIISIIIIIIIIL